MRRRTSLALRFTIVAITFNHLLPGESVSAFKDGELAMSFGQPVVTRSFSMADLQEYICTIERAIDDEPNLDMLKENHEELCKEAPTGADFEEYLLSYARAIKGGNV
jgi:hypothetical protein